MTLKNTRLAPKITELFDILEVDMEAGDYIARRCSTCKTFKVLSLI